jgi:hypothetical protein
MPQEPAYLTSAGMDAGAQAGPSERRAGGPQRTSGDGAWAAPNGCHSHPAAFKRLFYRAFARFGRTLTPHGLQLP